ncbi:MAG TPA: hypothetical protein VKY92_24615 [Verrucomicrobiae bacterium]|nr:hypothetical protein [Verrucomicrobiae bacterium]
MRPRFVLLIMVITLAFLLILMMSPGFWHRKAVDKAALARFRNPTPENVEAVRLERARARRGQYMVCSLVVANVMAIIVYGAVQHRKGKV